MTKLFKNYVIFSFDNPWQLHTAHKFYKEIDSIRASTKILGAGYYDGFQEPSIMMDYNSFMENVRYSDFLKEQESILILNPRTPRSNVFQGYLHYLNSTKSPEYVGIWTDISGNPYKIMNAEAWSYFNGSYYTCVK